MTGSGYCSRGGWTAGIRTVAIFAVVTGLPVHVPAGAATIDVPRYQERLEAISKSLRAGASKEASERAAALLRDRIAGPKGESCPDPTVLDPIAQGRDPEAVAEAAARLDVLIRELRRSGSEEPGRASDVPLLERLRHDQTEEVDDGGDVPGLKLEPDLSPLERFWSYISPVVDKLREWMEAFFRWLGRVFGVSRPSGGGEAGVSWLAVIIVVLIAVVLAAAVLYLRNRTVREPAAASGAAPAAIPRDADPLSREAGEWERYAEQLAASGRLREAIRAWYHAVLVALYRGGLLHYRKGRTNWEYVSTLPPKMAWRAAFIDVTREFEREWYGGRQSTSEALSVCVAGARQVLSAVRAERKES